MIHFNLGSHDGRTIDELPSLVERVSTEVSTERAALATKFAGCRESAESEQNQAGALLSRSDFKAPSLSDATCDAPSLITEQPAIKKFPLPCHGANQAYDAGVEMFQGQFGGEEA